MPRNEHGQDRRDVGLPGRRGAGGRPVDVAFAPSAATFRPAAPTGSRPEPAHAHRPATARSLRPVLLGLATTLVVFALAVALVTVLEVVVDHPLSGGDPGATTLGELIHPRLAPGVTR
ncbi:hypothetical protein [Actinomycetospora sp. TBRC 11914]|uniref:hypothetical protein n=1 Tax=Actinomycetospora sp. TBRC 11914 TaxID=2729387 RepID=UPI00145C4771|nr:hypothetical protein [Actinomycetospora sp. TBRC 11914]NMO91331.1 hypothetical protein [Actinomycetospora sp. TBRC 11914]